MIIENYKDGAILRARVTPRASGNQITGERSGRLGIRLTSPPIEGRANKDLVKFLAKKLGIAPSSITILSGHRSRDKDLQIVGLDAATVSEKLKQATG